MAIGFPLFLMAMGLIVMWQPRTERWKKRLSRHLNGNEKRLKQRANTFFLLGFAFVLAGFALLYRITTQ